MKRNKKQSPKKTTAVLVLVTAILVLVDKLLEIVLKLIDRCNG